MLQCDNHPEAYKNEYLERIDSRRDHQIILMALLDVIDPCKPSKQADLRRKSSSNNHSQMKSERVNAQPSNPTEKKSNNKYNDKPQFRRNSNTNYSRNNTSSGNNPLPTNYSIMAERKEIANDHNKPLAWLENKVKSVRKRGPKLCLIMVLV